MKPFAVVGPSNSGKTTLVERLLSHLDGRVATVKHLDHAPDIDTEGKDTARHRAAGADATYGVSDEGWFATGEPRPLSALLDDLAPEYEYVVVEGYSKTALPAVVLGGRDHAGPTIAAAPEANEIDLESVLGAVDALESHVTLDSLIERAKADPKADRAGAIATFTGRVRAKDSSDDTPTDALEFEMYEGVAEQKMESIAEELEAREGVVRVLLHHRTGVIEAGEDIVFVVVLAGHREEAFETVSDGIDRLKAEIPIFKKERTSEEEFWVHERA